LPRFQPQADHFFIVSETGKVLDIQGGSKQQGAKLILWPFHGGLNQQFKFDEHGFITSVHSGLVLDVETGAKQGNHIIQFPKHGGENQLWRIHRDGTIRLENNNLVVDIQNGSTADGAALIAWPHHGQTNQRFRIVNQWS